MAVSDRPSSLQRARFRAPPNSTSFGRGAQIVDRSFAGEDGMAVRRQLQARSIRVYLVKRTWTIIGVRDVPRSLRWYQSLFGQPETPPNHPDFGQLLDADGTVLVCLHQWGAHEHPSLRSPDEATPGNGLLLFFRVDDYETALPRARALVPRLEEEPHLNPSTRTKEFSLRDPDGYYVTISALSAAERNGAGRRRPPRRLQETRRARPKESRERRRRLRG
jgi:catechol 2,3-dioxygenase-like lactoylglutathione lyase family enzyme